MLNVVRRAGSRTMRFCFYCGEEPARLYLPLDRDLDHHLAVYLCADCRGLTYTLHGTRYRAVADDGTADGAA